MKKIKLLFLFVLALNLAIAQNGDVGIGTTAPNSSAALDITSTTKGLLVPRMTTAERNLIASPAFGLMIFNITTGSQEVNIGTAVAPVWSSSKSIVAPFTLGIDNDYNGTLDSSSEVQRVAYNGDGTPKTDADTQYVFESGALRIGTLQNVAGTPVFRGNYASLAPRALNIGNETGRADISLQTYQTSNASQITGVRSRGTFAAPAAVIANDRLFRVSASAQWGSTVGNTYFGVAAIDLNAETAFNATNRATNITFSTTPIASSTLTERMRISAAGNVGIGTNNPTAQLHTTGSVVLAGAGTPGLGKVLTSDATGLATWQTPATGAATTASNGLTATSGDIQLGGTLTSATTIAQGSNDLTFSGTGRTIVAGSFQTQGLLYAKPPRVHPIASSITWQADDVVILLQSTHSGDIVFPSASANPNRLIGINNRSGSARIIANVTGGDTGIYSDEALSQIGTNSGVSWYVSDGISWRLYSGRP